MHESCYLSKEKQVVIDVVVNGRSSINHQSLEEIRMRYPDAVEMSLDAATQWLENQSITAPSEIDEDGFLSMFEVLPPSGWTLKGNEESFKLCEHYRGRVTTVCVRIGGRYFSFLDIASLPHEKCVEKVNNWIKEVHLTN